MAADSRMDTCSCREISDLSKRPLDGDVENGTTKRSHYGESTYHFKMLIPSAAAGAIIGKRGETIAKLQKDVGAHVKMSKANDYYPGTSERVCLIRGTATAIMEALQFIAEKIRDKPDIQDGQDVKLTLLVPNSTAGMIIGKGGNYVKQIKKDSGAYVQLSQKARDQILQERCITVIGEMENCKKACELILQKIVEDPTSGSCLNISYSHISGPVANHFPCGSPYAKLGGGGGGGGGHRTPTGSFGSTASLNSSVGVSGMLLNGGGGPAFKLSLNLGNPAGGLTSATLTAQLLEHIKVTLRGSGYTEQATAEITAAMRTLAQYGILGMGLGLAGSPSMGSRSIHANGMGGNSSVFGPIGTVSGGDYGMGRKCPNDLKEEEKKVDMEIAENIVGAILGPGGQALVEIQHLSGANIQISKKGTFAPGTTNCIVTITGSSNAISTAQFLIEQRISAEKAKRARSGAMGGSMQ